MQTIPTVAADSAEAADCAEAADSAGPAETPEARGARRRALAVRVGTQLAILGAFLAVTVMTRGGFLGYSSMYNPDEAELIAQGRAALHNPVPFTTWTAATTGPIWPQFLALVGALGFPLTIAFSHFLSCVFYGVMGYLGFTIARRHLQVWPALAVTALWWLPMVFVMIGGPTEHAGLNTELLPAVLVLGAAAVRTDWLARNPWHYVTVGLLCGLAFGAKFQVLPLAVAVPIVHFLLVGDRSRRGLGRAAGLFSAGAVAPFVVIVAAVLVTPSASMTVIRQWLNFLGAYGTRMTLSDRLFSTWLMVRSPQSLVLLLIALWLVVLSPPVVRIARAIYALAGLGTLFAAGLVFGHYLIFMFVAIGMMFGLPLRAGARVVPLVRGWPLSAAVSVSVVVLAWLWMFGPSVGLAQRTHRSELAVSLNPHSVSQDPQLLALCPSGSDVVIWGWAPELYVNYSWNNAIPFLNAYQLVGEKNRESGYELLRDSIEKESTDCVVDAVGPPFFTFTSDMSLLRWHPRLEPLLEDRYTRVDAVMGCPDCAVYVRK